MRSNKPKYIVGYTICGWTIVGKVVERLIIKHEDFNNTVTINKCSFVTAVSKYNKGLVSRILDTQYRILASKNKRDKYYDSIAQGLVGNPLRYFTLSKIDGLTYYWTCNKCGKVYTSTIDGISDFISESRVCYKEG